LAKKQFDQEEINFRKVFETFTYWPKILKLLYKINKKYLIVIILLNVIVGIVPAINLLVTQKLINSIIIASGTSIENRALVIIAFVQLLTVGVISNVIGIIKRYCQDNFQKILAYDINIQIMTKASNLSLKDFDDSDTYDKLQRAQKEAGYRPFEILMSMLTIISAIVTLVSSALVLILWKWWIACILVFVPVLSTVSLLKQGQREFLVQWKRAPESRKSWYITYLLTRDTTFKEIKLYNLGEHLINKYTGIFKKFFREDKALITKRSILTFIFDMINQTVVGIVTGIIIFSTVAGEIMIGNLVGYMKAVALTQSNSMLVLNTIFRMYQNNLYIKQLFEFLELPELETKHNLFLDEEKSRYEIKVIEKIEFKNVSFKYEKAKDYAIHNVNFTINKNESIAIVGENGSGKTTLVKLLTGLYDISQGEILINNISINKINKKVLREKIGVALQDFIKYELPARENIGFGDLNLINDDAKLYDSARYADIDTVIKELPKGLDNQLGVWFAEGTQLSGGQWQKIALSRSFLKNSNVYVLDEPNSALDPLSEREIFNKFYKLTNNKIGIFISHRFSTVKKANKILVFNKGKLIEQGTHDELIQISGHYAELYNVQAEPYK